MLICINTKHRQSTKIINEVEVWALKQSVLCASKWGEPVADMDGLCKGSLLRCHHYLREVEVKDERRSCALSSACGIE